MAACEVINKTVLAIGAHPDDIEFLFAGTLLLLKAEGWQVHVCNLANGSAGSKTMPKDKIVSTRRNESRNAAAVMGAIHHDAFFDDLGILYTQEALAEVSALVRAVRPTIILTHPPRDYMEDHETTCRLAVTAAMAMGIPNFRSEPECPSHDGPVAIYHSPPLGCVGPLGERIEPSFFVDISTVVDGKLSAILCHESQMSWLGATQEMPDLGSVVLAEARLVGSLSGAFSLAEGWTPHHYRGFCPPGFCPLEDVLAGRISLRRFPHA